MGDPNSSSYSMDPLAAAADALKRAKTARAHRFQIYDVEAMDFRARALNLRSSAATEALAAQQRKLATLGRRLGETLGAQSAVVKRMDAAGYFPRATVAAAAVGSHSAGGSGAHSAAHSRPFTRDGATVGLVSRGSTRAGLEGRR